MSEDLSGQIAGILGLGNIPEDGHLRKSEGEFFTLIDGSEDGHEEMLRLCVDLQQALDQRGQQLGDLDKGELIALLKELRP